jgi:hypothetical protein
MTLRGRVMQGLRRGEEYLTLPDFFLTAGSDQPRME